MPKKILFLDDDDNLRDLVQLSASGFDVELCEVRTSGEARRILEDQGGIDAAILDVRVANGDGVDLYRWILQRFPKMQVVFFTGYADTDLEERIHAIGSAPIYRKPTTFGRSFLDDFLSKLGAKRRPQPA